MNVVEDRETSPSLEDPRRMDTDQPNHNTTILLKDMTSALGLHDIWKLHHPLDKEFTFFSHAHNSLSRIDNFFGTEQMLNRTSAVNIEDIAISDHVPITSRYEASLVKGNARIWRFPNYMAENESSQC